MAKGKYIVIEGLEGAGKSELVKALYSQLKTDGLEVQVIREPGGTHFAEELRTAIKKPRDYEVDGVAEALAFSAARRDSYSNVVKPLLDSGVWVISDRSFISMLAYQGYGRGYKAEVEQLFGLTYGPCFKFDTVVVLDVDPAAGLKRAEARGEPPCRIEASGLEFFRTVRKAFMDREQMLKYSEQLIVLDMENWFSSGRSAVEHAELLAHHLEYKDGNGERNNTNPE